MKTCVKCHVSKPVDQFHALTKAKDGKKSSCKACRSIERTQFYHDNIEKEKAYCVAYKEKFPERRKESANKWAAKRYKLWRNKLNFLKDNPCMDCGKHYPPCAMDFDHRDDEDKSFMISVGVSKYEEVFNAELAKCDLVCANCHRTRTKNRANGASWYCSVYLSKFKTEPCVDCQLSFEPHQMDFDHRDPKSKLFDVSKPKGGREAVLAEIDKCDIVCANCHRIRTFVK